MVLKLSGIRNQALSLLLAAILLDGGMLLTAVHLAMVGDWGSGDTLVGMAVVAGIYLLFAGGVAISITIGALAAVKKWRLLVRGIDAQQLPASPQQPNSALALHGGEELFLEHHRANYSSLIRESILLFVAFLLLGVLGDTLIVSVLPAFMHASFNPLAEPFDATVDPTPPMPNLLDWFTVALPMALGLILFFVGLISQISNRRQRISADDRGITVRYSGHHTQFIPWNDIYLALWDGIQDEDVAGTYTLFGREHTLSFYIHVHRLFLPSGKPMRQVPQFVFSGGYDAYIQDARRLIATIAARSMTPIRIARFFPKTQQRMQQRFPMHTLTRAQALNAPLATAPWQPLSAPPPAGTLVELAARPPFRPTAIRAIIWLIVLIAIIVGSAILSNASATYADPSMNPIAETFASPLTASIVIAALMVILVPAAYTLASTAYTQRYAPIKADDAGIMTGSGNKAVVVAWEEVRAWGIIPPPPGTRRAAKYVIFTDSQQRLTWQEPHDAALGGRGVKGDRQAAYRQRSEELHALIVAKTGQPLHDLAALPVASLTAPV